jgi:hypothetical protein
VDAEDPQRDGGSPAKLKANRLNALKSSGPRTSVGKRNSSRNSLKQGLLSRDVVIGFGEGKEDPEEYEALLSDLRKDFQPEGRSEEVLVETIAACDWRYRRALWAEVEEIVNGFAEEQAVPLRAVSAHRNLPGVEATGNLLRYQTTIYRHKIQAMQLLEKMQRRRRSLDDFAAANGNSPKK